jgi:hypothetical protein
MPSIRKRKDFQAEIFSVEGRSMGGCHAYVEIETVVEGDQREVSWGGRFTSLTNPEHSFRGPYRLKAARSGGEGAKISVHSGAQDRLGITSDEYEFRGEDAPPELP